MQSTSAALRSPSAILSKLPLHLPSNKSPAKLQEQTTAQTEMRDAATLRSSGKSELKAEKRMGDSLQLSPKRQKTKSPIPISPKRHQTSNTISTSAIPTTHNGNYQKNLQFLLRWVYYKNAPLLLAYLCS